MRFLIIKTSALGDVVQAFPVASRLKALYPSASIDWVVEKPGKTLAEAHPDIDRVIAIDTKKWRKEWWKGSSWKALRLACGQLRTFFYDAVYDLQGNTKSALWTRLSRSSKKVGFGKKSVPEWPNLLVTNQVLDPPPSQNQRSDYLYLVDPQATYASQPVYLRLNAQEEQQRLAFVERLNQSQQPKILLCFASRWENKQIKETMALPLLKSIQQKLNPLFFIAWGSAEEKAKGEQLAQYLGSDASLLPSFSLPLLQRLMFDMDLIIAADSVLLHLAGLTDTPTFSIFGPSSAHKYRPVGAYQGGIQGTCPYGFAFEKRCPKLRTCSTGACMTQLLQEELIENFWNWWKKIPVL